MYRLLNNISEPKAKTPRKKKSKDSDEDSSDSDDREWKKKSTKAKTDLWMIEQYRKINDCSTSKRKPIFVYV